MTTGSAPPEDAKRLVPEIAVSAARFFYCVLLGGRHVWRSGTAVPRDRLRFVVGDSVIETGPSYRNVHAHVAVRPEDAEDLAARCWDAGFSVYVRSCYGLSPCLTVVDPFGQRIDLVPMSLHKIRL